MTIKLNAATGGGSVSLSAPNSTTSNLDVELTLPVDDGAANTFLKSDGAGTLSWASASSDSITEGNTSVECVDTGSNGHITFDTEGTERLRIESDGDVLSKPNNSFDIQATTTGVSLRLQTTNTGTAVTDGCLLQMAGDNNVYFYNKENADIRFGTNDTERMRITSDGRVGVNATNFTNGRLITESDGSAVTPFVIRDTASGTGSVNSVGFFRSSTQVGSISLTGSATAYNTSSDYRLKENVVPLTGAIDRLNQLQVRRFNFIADPDKTVDGFIAHEAQAVVPEAVTGTQDEVQVWKEGEELPDGVSVGDNKLDEDGNTIPVYQGIDQSKLVPLLTAALQEAIAKIETLETANASLEARLTALEGGAS